MSGVDLAALETASRQELIDRWTQLFGMAPSKRTGRLTMTRIIAYELQARAEGGLSPALRRRLADLANGQTSQTLSKGAQLVREWNGESHVVDVLEGGYRWRDQTYRSLSAVAEAITGAKWSGPRFFGLRK